MAGLTLRPYQVEACDAVLSAWMGGMARPAVVAPTGTGKTVTFAELVRRIRETPWAQRGPSVVLVHRDELVHQTVAKLHATLPGERIGIVKAERHETEGVAAIVASVQTLSRPARLERMPEVSMVVVDECHHAAAPSYLRVLEGLGCFAEEQWTPAVGFTATMSREDNRGLGDVWQDVVFKREILTMINDGWLCDVRCRAVIVEDLDLNAVKRSRGDFNDGDLGEALEASSAPQLVAEKYVEEAGKRQGILFAPTVAAAYTFAYALNAVGVVTETITGTMPTEDRALVYKRFRTGETQVLSNCMVLTEGFDAPWAEVCVIARPTKSVGLFIQMVGRVLRLHPGKSEALVLDVQGVSSKLKLASIIDLSETKPNDGESVLEASLRETAERENTTEAEAKSLAARTVDVDLFSKSDNAWLKTTGPRGIWFIPTKDYTFFLWDNGDDTWRIGRCDPYSVKGGTWLAESVDFGMAMPLAESYASEVDPSISSRKASWRKGKRRPTAAQVRYATNLGIAFDAATVTKSELSDLIWIHNVTGFLDRSE